jgi:hypothetical protein
MKLEDEDVPVMETTTSSKITPSTTDSLGLHVGIAKQVSSILVN